MVFWIWVDFGGMADLIWDGPFSPEILVQQKRNTDCSLAQTRVGAKC